MTTYAHILFQFIYVVHRSGGLNLNDMYSNLPRSLKSELLVKQCVEEDEEVIKKRQKMVESMKPSELGNINGLGDFPIPNALESIFKSGDKPVKPPRNKDEKRE